MNQELQKIIASNQYTEKYAVIQYKKLGGIIFEWCASVLTDDLKNARDYYKVRWTLAKMSGEPTKLVLVDLENEEEIDLTSEELPSIHDFSDEDLLSDYH